MAMLDCLVDLAMNANSESVRVSAANSVIDRAFGRLAPEVRATADDTDQGAGRLDLQWLDPEGS